MIWQSGGRGGPKKEGCHGLHDLNTSDHLKQKSRTDS